MTGRRPETGPKRPHTGRYRNPAVVAVAVIVILSAVAVASTIIVPPPPSIPPGSVPPSSSVPPTTAATTTDTLPATTTTSSSAATLPPPSSVPPTSTTAATGRELAEPDNIGVILPGGNVLTIDRRVAEEDEANLARFRYIADDLTGAGHWLNVFIAEGGTLSEAHLQTIANLSSWERLFVDFVVRVRNEVASRPPSAYNIVLLEEWDRAVPVAEGLVRFPHGEDIVTLTLPDAEPPPWNIR